MFDQIVQFVHLLATAVWLGGAIFIKMILEPSTQRIDPREAGKLSGIIAKRFSISAWIAILLLCITGILKTPGPMFFDTSSEAGIALAVKHVLVIGVILIGLVIALVAVPRLRRAAPAPGAPPAAEFLKAQKLLHRLSMTSTILGVGIIACVTFLW